MDREHLNFHGPAVLSWMRGKGQNGTPPAGRAGVETSSNGVHKSNELPEFFDPGEVEALIRFAPNPVARLCMCIQWRAGLTVDEALMVTGSDVHLEANPPELEVRRGEGGKDRTVPIHRHLGLSLLNAITMWKRSAGDRLVDATPERIRDWYQDALTRCYERGAIQNGRPRSTDALRHSAARHWLMNGVPINVVSKWLGHSNLSTTLIYAESVNDSGDFMARVS